MATFEEKAKKLAATAATIAAMQGEDLEAKVLRQSIATLVQTGSQWDGTISLYTLMLEIPIDTYAAAEPHRESLEARIRGRAAQIIRTDPGYEITQVVISPILEEEFRPPQPAPKETDAHEEVPSFWQPGFLRLFISHTHANKETAHRLKATLASYRVAAFVAHDDIEPTKEWEAQIELALRTMDAMAAIITPDFVQSRWCDQEVGFAIGRGKLVVPLCKDDAIPHGFLGKHQAFKISGLLPAAVAQELARILVEHPLSSERMMDALVERMATSKNWETSKRTMQLLEKGMPLNTSHVARLVQSIDANQQVASAPGVAERIRKLVSQAGKRAQP